MLNCSPVAAAGHGLSRVSERTTLSLPAFLPRLPPLAVPGHELLKKAGYRLPSDDTPISLPNLQTQLQNVSPSHTFHLSVLKLVNSLQFPRMVSSVQLRRFQ